MDPYQANLHPNLLLLNCRPRFNPISICLRVTFDHILSFSKYVSSLKAKFSPRLKALRYISAPSLGPSKQSLSFLPKACFQPLLTFASPGWCPFLSIANVTKLERLHRASSGAIFDCLSSSPTPLLFSEAFLPPLLVILTHITFQCYERALRLPASFPILS